jgi:hypothetical protein
LNLGSTSQKLLKSAHDLSNFKSSDVNEGEIEEISNHVLRQGMPWSDFLKVA